MAVTCARCSGRVRGKRACVECGVPLCEPCLGLFRFRCPDCLKRQDDEMVRDRRERQRRREQELLGG